MKSILLTLCACSFAILTFGQYQVGVPAYDTIYAGNYTRLTSCAPEADVTIELDAALMPYVSGLELTLFLTEVNVPVGGLSTDIGPISVGDSLVFESGTSTHSFYFEEEGSFHFILVARGIPEVDFELYPCELMEFVTQVDCENGYLITADELAGACTVAEEFIIDVNVDELKKEDIKIYPNPTSAVFYLENPGSLPITSIAIFDQRGKELRSLKEEKGPTAVSLDISDLPNGIYWVAVHTQNDIIVKKICKH